MAEVLKIEDVLNKPEYKFLNDRKICKEPLLVTFGGSHAYGTNVEGSDIDIRGIASDIDMLLCGEEAEYRYENNLTDTVIYGFNRYAKLAAECNPNILEILGCRPEHYAMVSPVGQKILDNADVFLSKYAHVKFAEYADSQLRRMQNALARDKLADIEKEIHILNSLKAALRKFDTDCKKLLKPGAIELYIPGLSDFEDTSVYSQLKNIGDANGKISVNINLDGADLRQFTVLTHNLEAILKNYDKLNNRNKKKDDKHLNKHAMHLVRLLITGYDVLSEAKIVTYREKEHNLLMSIRNGEYMTEDNKFKQEFFEIVTYYKSKLDEAYRKSELPDTIIWDRYHKFMRDINLELIETIRN